MWLGGLEAITDGLRDSKNLVLAGAKLAKASLFAVVVVVVVVVEA